MCAVLSETKVPVEQPAKHTSTRLSCDVCGHSAPLVLSLFLTIPVCLPVSVGPAAGVYCTLLYTTPVNLCGSYL